VSGMDIRDYLDEARSVRNAFAVNLWKPHILNLLNFLNEFCVKRAFT
jgi:hypothetical protein